MKAKLVHQLCPTENNARNSEGSFLRAPNGDILFAYSRYNGNSFHDNASCDIALCRSSDEGESFGESIVIAKASDFGVANLMSVSAQPLQNGALCFYFMIKETDGASTMGRVYSPDGGESWKAERCLWKAPHAYYVINNDRVIRLADGRLAVPAAYYDLAMVQHGAWYAATILLFSEDDGATFTWNGARMDASLPINRSYGLQEPGVIELMPHVLWVWMRTGTGRQYEAFSVNGGVRFTVPEPSEFTSPDSPMEIVRYDETTLYAIYTPVGQDNFSGRTWANSFNNGRSPLVVRRSTDNGTTWGPCHVIEDDEERGYCYPAAFFTKDGHMLLSYCRGGKEDKHILAQTGIAKIPLAALA